jgi:Flp pilus assembly protein TadG
MITGLMSFAVLSIDMGVLLTTRNQLQNAADAAALAGALALAETNGDEAAATDAAIEMAASNRARTCAVPTA